jgi:hypothetical protein
MLCDLPGEILEIVVKYLLVPHVLRQRPEFLRDAAALKATCRGTRNMGYAMERSAYLSPRPDEWLSLTQISKTFLLRPADRENIPVHITFEGPRYRAWPVKWWLRKHAVIRCLQKFGSIDAYDAEMRRLQMGRTKRQAARQRKIDARREVLRAALEQQGCSLREDSHMCTAYIESGDGDPVKIAKVMREMSFYCDHTRYASFLQQIIQEDLDDLGYANFPSASECAKTQALTDWANRFANLDVASSRPELPPSLAEILKRQARRLNRV